MGLQGTVPNRELLFLQARVTCAPGFRFTRHKINPADLPNPLCGTRAMLVNLFFWSGAVKLNFTSKESTEEKLSLQCCRIFFDQWYTGQKNGKITGCGVVVGAVISRRNMASRFEDGAGETVRALFLNVRPVQQVAEFLVDRKNKIQNRFTQQRF
jgi:hypothetical protein